MKSLTMMEHKKVLVLGLAKSGVAAAELLHKMGAFVTVNDAKPFEENQDAQRLLKQGITVICGRHPEDLLDEGFELVVKNPGIPYTNILVADAVKRGIPVWTEVELAYLISKAPIIGITGSNGKTTTTTLLYHILNQGGLNPLIAGNIGTVACSVTEDATEDNVIVTELSSFQLMGTEQFKPKIAIWTNLYEAHIDYHGSMKGYGDAKFGVTRNQDATDYLIYNADQKIVAEYASKSNAHKIPFTTNGINYLGISADDDMIYWLGKPFIERSIIALPGQHNLENVLVAVAAAIIMECPKIKMEHVLSSFTGVKHRTQFVREWQGRKIFNDSKATNALATRSALAAFNQPIVLLAGGLDRGHSFEELRPHMSNVHAVVVTGETAGRFAEFAKSCGVEKIAHADQMESGVEQAANLSNEGDVILLSPACASWDQYPTFEIRGDKFIEAAMKL
ncbi:UDP-N-acetylmuramoyl-L-alanine--D-glutamate ligase [Viridibacillus sp. YIM B01967]|uniref:UDP-N-acetylmuramoylalanine--D-glutamate ligase n=1 Tax=Viridibacillus soli TaxID=2798301 RepID=A0ABS1H529_9BACL|nr:UDP-N-acetylmuramoyl-L-alanine--D-glutamate ligase [Viridibacillus soli]MBK3494490.1 UDP-N-acetylmuramoyl-L-alanine--D-glutamate ligase [Viridibacillus soli]